MRREHLHAEPLALHGVVAAMFDTQELGISSRLASHILRAAVRMVKFLPRQIGFSDRQYGQILRFFSRKT